MTRKNKNILFGGITLFAISYIVYNRWEKRIFYDEMLKRIGGGTVNFSDLKIWKPSFLIAINQSGRNYQTYKQDVLREQALKMNDALDGLGTKNEQVISIFRFFNSKVGIVELINFYNAKYTIDLKSALEDDMSDYWLTKIGSIVSQKPDVIYN